MVIYSGFNGDLLFICHKIKHIEYNLCDDLGLFKVISCFSQWNRWNIHLLGNREGICSIIVRTKQIPQKPWWMQVIYIHVFGTIEWGCLI